MPGQINALSKIYFSNCVCVLCVCVRVRVCVIDSFNSVAEVKETGDNCGRLCVCVCVFEEGLKDERRSVSHGDRLDGGPLYFL